MPNKPDHDDSNVKWGPMLGTPGHIKKLEHQINHDQAQPVKPSEKRVKLNMSFEDAVRQMARKPLKEE